MIKSVVEIFGDAVLCRGGAANLTFYSHSAKFSYGSVGVPSLFPLFCSVVSPSPLPMGTVISTDDLSRDPFAAAEALTRYPIYHYSGGSGGVDPANTVGNVVQDKPVFDYEAGKSLVF